MNLLFEFGGAHSGSVLTVLRTVFLLLFTLAGVALPVFGTVDWQLMTSPPGEVVTIAPTEDFLYALTEAEEALTVYRTADLESWVALPLPDGVRPDELTSIGGQVFATGATVESGFFVLRLVGDAWELFEVSEWLENAETIVRENEWTTPTYDRETPSSRVFVRLDDADMIALLEELGAEFLGIEAAPRQFGSPAGEYYVYRVSYSDWLEYFAAPRISIEDLLGDGDYVPVDGGDESPPAGFGNFAPITDDRLEDAEVVVGESDSADFHETSLFRYGGTFYFVAKGAYVGSQAQNVFFFESENLNLWEASDLGASERLGLLSVLGSYSLSCRGDLFSSLDGEGSLWDYLDALELGDFGSTYENGRRFALGGIARSLNVSIEDGSWHPVWLPRERMVYRKQTYFKGSYVLLGDPSLVEAAIDSQDAWWEWRAFNRFFYTGLDWPGGGNLMSYYLDLLADLGDDISTSIQADTESILDRIDVLSPSVEVGLIDEVEPVLIAGKPYLWESGDRIGSWLSTDWYGYIYDGSFPWVYKVGYGWLYCSSADAKASWMYSPERGWVWNSYQFGAWTYVADDESWEHWLP